MYWKIGIGIVAAAAIGIGILKRKELGKKMATVVTTVGNIFTPSAKSAAAK